MRWFRVLTACTAALALTVATACKESTSGLGDITCAAGDPICPPDGLEPGYTGATGTPTIVPGTAGTSVTVSTSAYAVTGTTTATLPGYWLLVTDGTLSSWGVLTITGGVYTAQVPLFCGEQTLLLTFTNAAGRSYYVVAVNRTGCVGPAGFRVQLTWQSDPTSDLDLHLLRPGGSVFSSNDCYYGNCKVANVPAGLEWGATGASGNPILDVDDVTGYGPENTYLASGAESGEYRVIIHNYDGTVGEVATVKIYFNDVEAARYTSQALDASTHLYWEVAKVNIATHTITTVNAYSSTTPTTLNAPPAWEPMAK